MGLNYKCPECGTALGFEGLCWSCRAKHHREEVNNWSLQEIEEKKKQVIEKLKVTEKDEFFSSDEYELFNDLMTRGIDCKEIARVACKREIYYPSELYYKADGEIRDKLIEKLMDTQKRMESLSTSEYEDLNFEVHTGIWTAADNMRLYKMLSNLWNGPSIGFTSPKLDHYIKSTQEHIDILTCIKNHDAKKAKKEMEQHIERSMDNILKNFKFR